jgi:hypothetical protein
MGNIGPQTHFLVEWYRPALADEPLDISVARLIECAESMSAAGSPVCLRATLATPADEVVLAVFGSADPQSVAEVCRRAGCPPQRLTSHVDARFWTAERRGSPDSSNDTCH